MRVGLWHSREDSVFVDYNPQPNDVIVDIPQKILDRYEQVYSEWSEIQRVLGMFGREQDRRNEWE